MARSQSIEAELGAMRSEIENASKRRAQSEAPSGPAADAPEAGAEPSSGDLAATLDDLRRLIGEYADNAEELASDHPFAVAGTAFLLGFSLGRLSK